MAGRKILIIDDEPQFLQTARLALQNGHAVLVAETRPDGVRQAREERPDVIVVGFVDEQGDAFRACRELREDPQTCQIPVLIVDVRLKEYARKGWKRQEVLETKPAGYLVRPVPPEELSREVQAIVSGGSGQKTEPGLLVNQIEAVLKRVKEVEQILAP